MKNENIPESVKSKSIKEIKEEISQILEKLESKDINISESISEYQRLLSLNKKIESLFKERGRAISTIGKKEKKQN